MTDVEIVGDICMLRSAAEVDIPYIYRYRDPVWQRFLDVVDDEALFATLFREQFINASPHLAFVIGRREDAFPLGILSLERQGDNAIEISFALGRRYRGNGFAAEAVRLAARFALVELGVEELWARVSATNTRSLALLAGLGFEFVRDIIIDTENADRCKHLLLKLPISAMAFRPRGAALAVPAAT